MKVYVIYYVSEHETRHFMNSQGLWGFPSKSHKPKVFSTTEEIEEFLKTYYNSNLAKMDIKVMGVPLDVSGRQETDYFDVHATIKVSIEWKRRI